MEASEAVGGVLLRVIGGEAGCCIYEAKGKGSRLGSGYCA